MSEKAERLYERARALPPEARAAFIREACGDDPELRDDLLSLLEQAESAEEFFGLLGDAVFATDLTADPAPSTDLPPGHPVGHYRIVQRVGSGGMGTVYRARDTRLGRDVALKFLPSYLRAGGEAEERLLIEARAAAALEHPNVCTVHEIGETGDGRPFIAMAFYEGETLKDRLRRGPLAPEDATQVAAQIARGLRAAHARGIVHRDVKPGNVILTADGTVKLLDFGLAKMTDVHVTRPGATPGTVAYMSPEQVRGDALNARTDLWSLGVVLYEMLSGARPFRGGSDRVLLQAILHDDPEPITMRRPETPAPLARIVERLLEKKPESRYASADELLADLVGADAPPPGDAAARLRARLVGGRRAALLAGTAAALVTLAGIGLWLSGRGEDSAPAVVAERAERPSIAVLPLADLGGDGADAALADGMTEELITILAQGGGLRVIASTSAFAFKGSRMDVRRVADSLGVANILEGNVRRTGDRLRLQVRLVDARDGSTRWSETYDREFGDVFEVQDSIARAVAAELDVRLAGVGGAKRLRHQTPHIAAYEFYLRGSDPSLQRSDSGVRQGVEYFKLAIAADSNYAAAYAGLARMYLNLGNRDDPGMPPHELHALAEQAALEAVALDDSLAEAHATLGLIREFLALDLTRAETDLKRAIALDPTHALIRQWLAQLYIYAGRPEEALAEARRALENDPLSPSAHAEVAHALLANGRYDEALVQLERIAGVRPPLLRAAHYTAQAYARKGMWPEAIAALRPQAERGYARTLSLYGYMLARAGQRDEAVRVHATLLERWRRGTSDAFDIAVVYAGLGDLDQAFGWLDRSIDDRSVIGVGLHVMSPILEDLHNDPRFARVRERLGLQKR